MRILIVEDDNNSRVLLERALLSQGYAVDISANGVEALAKATLSPPDLIVSDIMMPEMDGFELCRRVKTDEQLRGIPFVFYTATFIEPKDEQLAMSLGASCFLIKPMTPEDLFKAIGKIIEEHQKKHLPVPEHPLVGLEELTAMQMEALARKLDKKVRELEQERESLRQAMEFLPIPISLSDAQGMISYINNAFSNHYGYTKEDIPSLATWALHAFPVSGYRDESMALWNADIAQAARTGTTTQVREYRVACKGGETRQVEIVTRPVVDLYVTAFNDITERLTLENQLHQAQKMEAIGQLASGVAHDFNNILTAIIGYSSLMQMTMESDNPHRGDVQQILNAAKRATMLTQSLLTFSRKQVVKLERVDLGEVVANFEKFLLRLIREDIELKIKLADQKLPMIADHGQIEQLLMNLVTNAGDAMPRGGRITIETGTVMINQQFIKAHGFGLPGEYAVLMVTDTGEGIPEILNNKIFEPFFTTKEQGKGTGLGLSMVYGIVQKHNGFIKVYSEPETGSTFKIYLPLAGLTSETKIKGVETQPAIQGGNETILIAEDDDSIRQLGITILNNYGYRVVEATDGHDAVAKFMENRNDIALVVLDRIMPKMNGKEAWQQIKALKPEIKAIFLSGYAEDIFTSEGTQNEGVVFIQKPASPQELLQKIRELLDSEKTASPRREAT